MSDPHAPHVIRLRGPWRAELPDRRVVPFSWPWDAPHPGATLIRAFQRPTGLSGCRVDLVVAAAADVSASINHQPLPPARRWDVTTLLQPQNELRIETVQVDAVWLEIFGGDKREH